MTRRGARGAGQVLDVMTTSLSPLDDAEHGVLRRLLDRARPFGPVRVAVVQPIDAHSLGGALEGRDRGYLEPILVGNADRIRATARALEQSLHGLEVVNAADDVEAAARAIELIRAGHADMLMKGHIHTDDLMRAVLDRTHGLRTGRRLTHAFVCCLPTRVYPKPLAITDGALNVAPDLETKRHIAQNAIDLMRALGVDTPRVAVLAAVETVTLAMPATIDAAALSKMADRNQIRGGIVDGPLALDNALSAAAARIKGITSPVAGEADILLVPNIEAGNIAVKQTAYLAGGVTPGVVLGAQVPVLLTSRADPPIARLASCAIAVQITRGRV